MKQSGDLLPLISSATLVPGRVLSQILLFGPGKRAVEEFEDILDPHRQVHKLPKDGAAPLLLSLCLVHTCVKTWTERIWHSIIVDHNFSGEGQDC
jgi:hypothetical protein